MPILMYDLIEWTVRPSKQTPAKVTTLYLSAEDCIAGVKGAAGEYSSTFSIPLSGSAGWTLNPIPEDSDKILQVIPGFVNGRGNGIFVLYHLKNDDQGIAFSQKDSNPSSTYSIPNRTSYDMASVTRESAFSCVSSHVRFCLPYTYINHIGVIYT